VGGILTELLVSPLDAGAPIQLAASNTAPTGHILYNRETTAPGIWAVPFSVTRMETTGSPFVVVAGAFWPVVTPADPHAGLLRNVPPHPLAASVAGPPSTLRDAG
jgi:hypothetical protein